MKRILFKIQQFPHLSETFILAQIAMAVELGYKVEVLVQEILSFEESTHLDDLKKYNLRERIILEDYKIPKNRLFRLFKAGLLFLKNLSDFNSFWRFLKEQKKFSLSWVYQFNFYKRFQNTEIIHIQYGTNKYPVDVLKSVGLLKGRLIVSFHGHDAFFPINGFIPNDGYYRYLFSGDNIVVANTPYLAEKILEIGCPKKNLITIPVGVNTDFFNEPKNRPDNNSLRFIHVGRLDKVKGQKWAIKLIYEMQKRNHSVQLTIIGDGIEKDNLCQQIRDLNLEECVFLVGKKSQNEIKHYLQRCDVYLITSVPLEDARRETQGLATLEAEACGLPVLAFNSGGVKYTIEDNSSGFLCEEYDMNCLVEKAILLLDDDLRKEMGENARKFVEKKFSQNVLERKWGEVYRNV